MKLRRLISSVLAVVMIATAIPVNMIAKAEGTTATATGKINAGDETFVQSNRYIKDGTGLGSDKRNQIVKDRPALYDYPTGLVTVATADDLSGDGRTYTDTQYRWPYAALKVTVKKDGEYDLTLNVNGKKGATYNTFGMLVDGVMHVLKWNTSGAKHDVKTKVNLSAGTHIIAFTTPMPQYSSDARKITTDDWNVYAWFNFNSFTLGEGMVAELAPTSAEVAASIGTRIEAEDATKAFYDSYDTIDNSGNIASGGKTMGGVSRGNDLKQSYTELSKYLNKAGMAYVQYAVEAPADGTYHIRVGYLAASNDTSKPLPFTTVLVNGMPYKAQFTNSWGTKNVGNTDAVALAVQMKKGINLIRCTALTIDQACFNNAWLNQDYLDVDSKLTVLNANTLNKINAGDATKVLANIYTDNGDTLGGLNGTTLGAMREFKPSIENLHLTGDKLVEWPWAAVKVTAAKDGYYDITANIGPNTGTTSKQIAMIIDGKVVCQPFTVSGSVSVNGSVFLTAGAHLIVFTVPMPKTAADAAAITSSTSGNAYPWCDYKTFEVDSRLVVENAPTLAEVKADLGVCIQATDKTQVIYDNYKNHNVDNSGMVANPNADYLKNNRVSLETLLDAGWDSAPYTAFEVKVEHAGEYDIYASVMTRGEVTSGQLAMVIDGKEVKSIDIAKTGSKQLVGDSVHLEPGTHLIAFTTPMPKTDADAQAIPLVNNDWTQMNYAYPWFNVYEFYLGNGLLVSNNFNVNSMNVGVIDTSKVSKNWSTYKDSDDEDNTADYLGAITDDYKIDRISVETVLDSDLSRLPYVSITVEAEADGYYDVYANIMTKSDITSKCAAMIVDGKIVYPISVTTGGKKQDIGAIIPLTKGTHTIAITSAMPRTEAEAQAIEAPSGSNWTEMNKAYPWFDFYSVTVSGRLSVVSGAENPLIDKSVLFVGDSITNSENSWASKIGTWNHMDWTNAGVGGATISTIKGKHIIHQLKANTANDYDYVIMSGGINDAMSEIAIGTVSESWNVADFDNTTYIGALETMFYYAYENFDGARLGYIITYATPNSNFGGFTQDMKDYYAEAKRACVKWNIPYIDLYEGTVVVDGKELSYSYDILQVDKNADIFINNDEHEIHINDEGYKIITPYIDKWMQTIGDNANPLNPDNRVKYIDAGDEAKVLYNGFTVSEGMLIDRDYTGMSEDEANIEILPYAKELLGDWAFASVKVNAEKAGDYKIMVEYSAKNATQMGMLVDGEVYTLEYTKKDGYCQFIEQTVYLTAGTHYVTFTAAMPKETVDVVGDAWNIYPWTNIITIVVDAGLEVMNKPELSEITAVLATVDDMGKTVVNAGDETKVLSNYFKDNGDTLGNMDAGDLRYDKLTLDKVTVDHLHYMPYAALKVTAEADGNYDILLEVETNQNSIADHLGLIVDGKETKVVPFNIAAKTKIKATVYLEKGTHTLTFTSPMLETVKEFEAYAKENELTTGNGATHPWINFISFTLSKGLKAEVIPTIAEVEYPAYNRIEAENNKYVIYNGYTPEGEKASKASDGKVAGGVNRWEIEQTFEDLKTWIDASCNHIAYVEYAVEAPADGEYTIRPGFIADVNKNVENRNDIAKPFVAVLVNNDIYKAQYTADWGETQAVAVKVSLKKGQNIIRVTTYTSDQEIRTVSSWINQDFLDLDKRLTALERSTTVVEAEDSKFYNLLKPQDGEEKEKASKGKVLGSAQTIRAKSIGLTMENFTVEQIRMIPYFSYTVDAPMDGYYSISLNLCGDGRMPKSQIAVIADDEIIPVKYNRCGAASEKNKAIITVYLTKGEHNITFSSPIPLNAEDMANTNWSHRWMNFDYVTFHDGLKLAAKQKSPTTIAEPVRIEAEDVGLPNMTKVNAAAEGKDAKEGYVGGAKYRRSQSVAEIKKDGIDVKATPFVQYAINAKQAGTYTVYFSASYGIYKSTVKECDATVAIEVNGNITFQNVHCEKDKTNSSLIPVTMKLSAGNNVVRLTHLTSDSVKGEGYCWIDYNYIEIPASDTEKITFMPTNGVVEAERSEMVTYVTNSSSGSSGGQCLGNADYKYIDEKDITFDNLDVKNLGELSRVTYTVIVEKAGTYNLSVQFNGGVTNYTFQELVELGTVGFAISANEGEKQLVEFCPDASSGSYSRIVEVELKEGENKIMVTTTLADYMTGVSPRIEDEYRLYWMDHDALRLTAGVSNTNQEVEPYDVNDTDIDHAQLDAKEPTAVDSDGDGEGTNMVAVGIIAASTLALLGLFIFIILLKKRKKDDEENKNTNLNS